MKRLQLFFFFLTLFCSLTGAKDIRMEMQKELDEMLRPPFIAAYDGMSLRL